MCVAGVAAQLKGVEGTEAVLAGGLGRGPDTDNDNEDEAADDVDDEDAG